MIVHTFETDTRSNLAIQNRYLKDSIGTRLDNIDNKLSLILEKVTAGFESLRSNLKEVIQSSFENIFNNTNDENNILQKIDTATVAFSESLKGSSKISNNNNNNTLLDAKEGLKLMENAIKEAISSNMALYETERKHDMSLLESMIMSKYGELEAILNGQASDNQDTQTTIVTIAEQTDLLHQDLMKIREELASMKKIYSTWLRILEML